MTQARRPRRFGSTEHLASEAIAAYVDGELGMNAYVRASHHLSLCPDCAAEVDTQQQARVALRRVAGDVSMPSSLLGLLSDIPRCHPDQDPAPSQGEVPGIISFDQGGDSARLWPFRRRR
ncbi:zf-HC2 domain-containing protein [Rhodococcus spongiicola]|uniref:RNA polymerase subunit sigma-70 n=1 Tax=Rhodococcus spongiicola TaxID=2487352 RepID=A0A438B554_9NOCA|nr:zf-HC2 domain-containing protein [Rhodococcus spongiicola]RVW06102.1 RNA polymerase subunit sigma-70 [Rhodococcus spongiicola]